MALVGQHLRLGASGVTLRLGSAWGRSGCAGNRSICLALPQRGIGCKRHLITSVASVPSPATPLGDHVGLARGAEDGAGCRPHPAPPPSRPMTSAGLPCTTRLLCHMMSEKTGLRRCLAATCRQTPVIAMLDARLSSSYSDMGRLTRRCRRV
jgi:hypothetical protein